MQQFFLLDWKVDNGWVLFKVEIVLGKALHTNVWTRLGEEITERVTRREREGGE